MEAIIKQVQLQLQQKQEQKASLKEQISIVEKKEAELQDVLQNLTQNIRTRPESSTQASNSNTQQPSSPSPGRQAFMKREEEIEKVLQNSSHEKPKWYVIFNGPFRGIYTDWATASTHKIGKSVSHKSYLTKEAAEKALEESYKTIATEETQKSKQFVSLNQHLQSQTAKLNAFNRMKNIPTAKEKEEMRRPTEQKLIVPSITVAQLGVSNKGYPDKDERIICAPPTIEDLVYSFIEVLTGSSKIGIGPRQKDRIKINYCSKNLLIYSKFQERIDEAQLKVLSDFKDQIELF
nr:enzymatic polyprotein [Tanacetum cinerariifolium]